MQRLADLSEAPKAISDMANYSARNVHEGLRSSEILVLPARVLGHGA